VSGIHAHSRIGIATAYIADLVRRHVESGFEHRAFVVESCLDEHVVRDICGCSHSAVG
jgi:hypothetical protein